MLSDAGGEDGATPKTLARTCRAALVTPATWPTPHYRSSPKGAPLLRDSYASAENNATNPTLTYHGA